ncbi:DNA primase, partial [Candidatus Woesearchaeota archaeon]|nr:DNA primase [Candidatus Woesearchaeota archaeon]
KTKGTIIIPSSLDKAETSIVGAALEIIQRIGPCNANLDVTNIEDVRISKRTMVVERAKELLKKMMESTMPDSQELADEVTASVRVMEIVEYGKDRLPAGPAINESDEVIVVEGRADVLNLLKHGFKNAIAINGTSVPETIIELCSKKVVTAFVDGDRGGNLIIKELTSVADIDFVTKAPDGKEVEEITKKEIHKALRSRISGEQAKLELSREPERTSMELVKRQQPHGQHPQFQRPMQRPYQPMPSIRRVQISAEEKNKFKSMLEDLIGTRGAEILDSKLSVLGKVPISEVQTALKSIANAHAVVFDGSIEREIVKAAEDGNVKFLIGMDSKVRQNETRVNLLTVNEL